jgi:hypothetical protein
VDAGSLTWQFGWLLVHLARISTLVVDWTFLEVISSISSLEKRSSLSVT